MAQLMVKRGDIRTRYISDFMRAERRLYGFGDDAAVFACRIRLAAIGHVFRKEPIASCGHSGRPPLRYWTKKLLRPDGNIRTPKPGKSSSKTMKSDEVDSSASIVRLVSRAMISLC